MRISDVSSFDVSAVRRDFPLLDREVDGQAVTYLDSAATSLKPRCVIDAVVEFYEAYTANISRGVHQLADEATDRFEAARDTIASFINAEASNLVFTRNTTESINLVALSSGQSTKVLYSVGDHHSNYLPWIEYTNGEAVELLQDGRIDLDDLNSKLQTKQNNLLAIAHITNAFGAENPIQEIIAMAHANDCRVLLDASQSAAHLPLDVIALDCDFLCFSGHKVCGPSGVGVLYGKSDLLSQLRPIHLGGAMVSEVHRDGFVLNNPPWKFEAGTPNIEGVFGFAAACDYLDSVGLKAIHSHEQQLVREAMQRLQEIPGVRLFGPSDPEDRGAIVSFGIDGIEVHGLARILSNRFKIFVRSGYHCAQPAHETLDLPPTTRASFGLYSNLNDVARLIEAVKQISHSVS